MSLYLQQLHSKSTYLNHLLHNFDAPEVEIFSSQPQHYRMRAEFRIWHEGENISYAMFQAGSKANRSSLIQLNQFPAAAQSINDLMPKLITAIQQQAILKNRWFQCEFLATLSGEMLVTLIYHKPLDSQWEQAARQLQKQFNIYIIGRSKGQKITLTQDFVTEKLNIHGKTFQYRQIEASFTQPNAHICEKMIEWTCDAVRNNSHGDLLELYCGNGNFTLPLAQYFPRVLATEISKTSVRAAEWNIFANQINNIHIVRLSAAELTQALSGIRLFHRLQKQCINLQNYHFSTVLVDPPRAGIDNETLHFISQFNRIIYISCNPNTLCDNLKHLTQSHRITHAALFDQFPFTEHIESGVILQKYQ